MASRQWGSRREQRQADGGEVQVKMQDGRIEFLKTKHIPGDSTIDWAGWMKCEHCDTYVGKDGNMLGHLGRLSVYFIDPDGVWQAYTVACPQCVFGAFAHQEYRKLDFYRPAVPYDYEKKRYIPQGLDWKEWRALGAWAEKEDSYLDAARKISTEYRDARAALIEKLERWEAERSQA